MGMKSILVLAFLAGIQAGPINYRSSKCTETCIGTNKFSYEQGKTYSYTYSSSVITKINGATEDVSGMHVRATADIEVLDKCNFALRLRDVLFEESDPREENRRISSPSQYAFKRALEERPLRFSFQDGRIDHVCPEINERKWVTNIKRAILSAFQNSMNDFKTDMTSRETDVTGICDAAYKVKSKGWSTFSLEKKKDLLTCSNRHSATTAFQSSPYRISSKYQSNPLTKSEHKCTQIHFSSGNLKNIECLEEHIFRPFSKHNKGAITTAKHTLAYASEHSGVITQMMANTRKSDLLFEHEEDKLRESQIEKTKQILREICSEVSRDIRPSTPRLFSRLVYTLKTLTPQDLRRVQSLVAAGGICNYNQKKVERFFHDALPMLGTPSSIEVMSDLIIRDHVKSSEAKMWLTSLAFVQKPSIDMIKSLERLIEYKPTGDVMLSTSALINSYCRSVENCESEPLVQRIADVLVRKLNSDCRSRSNDERITIIMTLKALGNLGYNPRSAERLKRCISTKENPVDVRLAAIEAFRRQPCSSTDRSALNEIFGQAEEDSELRIAAYLGLMQCPSTDTMDTIKKILQTDTMDTMVNQVGSFIWTHLTNILETADVHKQNIKRILDDSLLKNTFDLDKRKFSRNFEKSMFAKAINTGAKIEGNLIWSQNSFVPRSGLMNITVDLFGHSMNLLEIGGRVEGLDRLLESYFGPKGYYGGNDINQRSKRSINDIRRVVSRFSQTRPIQDELKGSMFARVFGHEVSYMDMSKGGENSFNILELLIKLAQQHEIDYTKSFMFLDTSFALPTIAGMPLRMSINGTATINIKVNGKLDIRKLGASPRSVDIDGSITPSGAIELDTMMSVDANVARTGLKMVTTLHSSTTLDGKITLKDSEDMIVDFKMAREKLEVLNMKTRFYILHRDNEREQNMLAKNPTIIRKCTDEYFKKGLGIQICGQVSYPELNAKNGPIFPLSGPASFSIEVEKKDTHTSYLFEAKHIMRKSRAEGRNQYTYVGRLAFDTPGSKTNRKMAIDLNASQQNKAITYTVTTPWKSLEARAHMVDSEDMKRLQLSCSIDRTSEYSFTTEIQIEKVGEKIKYIPSVNIQIPRMKEIMVTGAIEYEPSRNYFGTLTIQNIPKLAYQNRFPYYRVEREYRPISLEGTLGKDDHRYSGNMRLRSEIYNTKTEGFIDFKQNGYKARISHDYGRNRKPEHNIVVNSKYRFRETESLDDRNLDLEVRLTQMPELNFATHFTMQKTDTQSEIMVNHQYGSNFADTKRQIKAQAFVKYNIRRSEFQRWPSITSNYKFTTTWPLENIDLDLSGKHNHDSKHIENEFKLISNKRPLIGTRFVISDNSETEKDYSGELKVDWKDENCFDANVKYSTEEGRHMVDTEIQFPYLEKIVLKTDILPNPKDLQIKGAVSYGSRFYSAATNYKRNDETHHIDGNVYLHDIVPVVFAFEVTPRIDNFNTKAQISVGNKIFKGEFKYNYESIYIKRLAHTELLLDIPQTRYFERMSFHILGNLNLIPSDRHSMKFEVKNMGATVGVFDIVIVPLQTEATIKGNLAMNFLGQQRSLNIDITQTNERLDGTIKVMWSPSSVINLAASGNLRKISDGVTLTGEASVESPISGYENLKVKLNHQHGLNSANSNLEISWNDNKLSSNFILKANDWSNVELGITITTPFNNFDQVKFHIKNTLSNERFITKSALIWPGTTFDFELSGYWNNGIGGTLKIRCPRYVENLDIKFSHILRGIQYVEHGEVTWGSSAYIGDMTIIETSMRNFRININLQTPHAGYRSLSSIVALHLNKDGVNMVLDGTLEGRALKLTTLFTKKPLPEIKIEMKTPIKGFKHMGFDGKLDFSQNHLITMRTFWNDKDAEMKIEINNEVQNYNGFSNKGLITIRTPFDILNQFKNTWTVSYDEGKLKCTIDVTHNLQAYALILNGDRTLESFNGDVTFKAPKTFLPEPITFKVSGRAPSVYDIEFDMKSNLLTFMFAHENVELTIKLNHRQLNLPYSGSSYAELNISDKKKLIWDNSWTARKDNCHIITKVTTPIPGYELLESTLILSYPVGQFKGDVAFTLAGKSADASLSIISGNTFEAELKMNTPFAIMKKLDAYSRLILSKHGPQIYKQGFTYSMDEMEDIVYSSTLTVHHAITLTTSLRTPFKPLTSLRMDITQTGLMPHSTSILNIDLVSYEIPIQGSGEMTLNGWIRGKGNMLVKDSSESVVVKSFFEIGDKKIMNLSIKTPSFLLNKLDFDVEQSGNLGGEYKHKFIFYYDVKYSRVDLRHTFNMRDWKNFDTDFDFMSPIKHAEYVHMRFNQKEEIPGKFITSLVVEPRPRRTISVINTFILAQNSLVEKLEITSPYEKLSQFRLELTQNGIGKAWENFSNDVKVTYNNEQVMTGKIEYVHMKKIIVNYQAMEHDLDIKCFRTESDASAEVSYKAKEQSVYTLDAKFETIDGMSMKYNILMNSWFKVLREFSMVYNLRMSGPGQYSVSRDIAYVSDYITVSSNDQFSYSASKGSITGSSTIKCSKWPSSITNTYDIVMNKLYPRLKYSIDSWLTGKNEIDASLNLILQNRGSVNKKVDAKITLKTPCKNWEHTKYEIYYTDDNAGKYVKVEFQNVGNGTVHSASLRWNPPSNGNFIADGTIKTPYSGFEECTLNINHERKRYMMYETTATLKMGNNQAKATFMLTAPQFQNVRTSFNLETSFPEVLRAGFTYIHGLDNPHIINIETHYNEKKISLHSMVYLTPKVSAKIELKTPFAEVQKFIIEGDVSHIQPYKVNIKCTYNDKEAGVLMFEHHGGIFDFRTEVTGRVLSQMIHYTGTYRHKNYADITFKSTCPYLRNINFNMKRTTMPGYEKAYESMLSWAEGKTIRITFGKTISFHDAAGRMKLHLNLVTPFKIIRDFSVKMDHSHQLWSLLNSNIETVRNGHESLGIGINLRISGQSFSGQSFLTFPSFSNRPTRRIDMTFRGSRNDNNVNGNLMAKIGDGTWSEQCHLKLDYTDESSYSEVKSGLSIKFSLPTRTIGFVTDFSRNRQETKSSVDMIFDESKQQKLGYTYKHSIAPSRSYGSRSHGEIIISTPIRSGKIVYDRHLDGHRCADEATLFWDHGRDEGRQLKFTKIFESTQNTKILSLSLGHPRLEKEISIRGEVRRNLGDVIASGRLDIEYSPNPMDKVTIFSSINNQNRNYSMNLDVTHPRTNTGLSLKSHIASIRGRHSAGTYINWMTASRNRNVVIYSEINENENTAKFILHSPQKVILILGAATETYSGKKIILTNRYDDRSLSSEIIINPSNNEYKLTSGYDLSNSKNKLICEAKLDKKKLAKVECYRMHNGDKIREGLASVALSTSQLITVDLKWRPELFEEIEQNLLARQRKIAVHIRRFFNYFPDSIRNEIMQRYNVFKISLPNLPSFEAEKESFARDWEAVKKAMNQLREDNVFYCNDIFDFLQSVTYQLRHILQQFYYRMMNLVSVYMRQMSALIASSRRSFAIWMNKLQDNIASLILKFRPAWQSYAYDVIRFYEKGVQGFNHQYERLMEHFDGYLEDAVKYLDEKFDFISYKMKPYWIKLQKLRMDLRQKLKSTPEESYYEALKESIRKYWAEVADLMTVYIDPIMNKLENLWKKLANVIDNALEKVLGHEYTQMVIGYAKKIWSKVVEQWEAMKVEENLKKIGMIILKWTRRAIQEKLQSLISAYLRLDKSGFAVWSPENGQIQFLLYLPTKMKDLTSWPVFNWDSLKQEANRMYNEMFPKSDYSFWDTYYKYLPSPDPYDWIPPFKAYAMVAGGSLFQTFDQRIFNFAGTCSYILVHDTIDNNFTVKIDYDKGVKKSITVISNGKQIKLFNDFRVTVDENPTDLPYQHMNTTVTRLGNQVRLHNELGLTVLCDNLNDICTLNISGWYFGKTAGLLGIYNNEPFDDFTTSEGRVTRDVTDFARSWQVDSSCVTQNLANPYNKEHKESACTKLFKENRSRFRPCFKQVEPLPFHNKCVAETSDMTEEVKSSKICQVAAAYVRACKNKRVTIRLPKRCVKCDAINGKIKIEGQQTRIKGQEEQFQSADIIFVVEEKNCNKIKSERLSSLANTIDTSLNAKGLRRNRFALVGFGGNGVHNIEHTHTLQMQLFGDAFKFGRATRKLDFTADGDNEDMMKAVNFAVKYPFRAGVRKIVILMPCSKCENQRISFAELQQVLDERDITLHMLMENAFRLRSVSKPYNIYGIDSSSVYTSKDIKQNPLRGNPQLYSQTYKPKDICIALALERNGSVFNSLKLTQGRRDEQKYFIDVMSRRIAATTDAPSCQICECLSDSVGGGRSVCRDCSLPRHTPFSQLLPSSTHLLGFRGENPVVRYPEGEFGIDFQEYFGQKGL